MPRPKADSTASIRAAVSRSSPGSRFGSFGFLTRRRHIRAQKAASLHARKTSIGSASALGRIIGAPPACSPGANHRACPYFAAQRRQKAASGLSQSRNRLIAGQNSTPQSPNPKSRPLQRSTLSSLTFAACFGANLFLLPRAPSSIVCIRQQAHEHQPLNPPLSSASNST